MGGANTDNAMGQRSGSLDNLVQKRDLPGKMKQRPRIQSNNLMKSNSHLFHE